MAASILSTATSGGVYTVVVTTDGVTAAAQFAYPAAPIDGRTLGQWQTDCQNAALGITNDPALGDGGPDASVAVDTDVITG